MCARFKNFQSLTRSVPVGSDDAVAEYGGIIRSRSVMIISRICSAFSFTIFSRNGAWFPMASRMYLMRASSRRGNCPLQRWEGFERRRVEVSTARSFVEFFRHAETAALDTLYFSATEVLLQCFSLSELSVGDAKPPFNCAPSNYKACCFSLRLVCCLGFGGMAWFTHVRWGDPATGL